MKPVDVVQAYLDRVYVDLDVDAVRELCTDPYTRHEAGEVHVLGHEQQIARVTAVIESGRAPDGRMVTFDTVLLTGDDESVSVLFDMTAPDDCPMAAQDLPFERADGVVRMCGAEIFKVTDGRISDVWNPPAMPGHWG